MFTLIAPYVCERMVGEGAVPQLFHLLATCNRSAPHQKIVGHGLRALLNIAKHAPLREALYARPDALPILVELVQGNYRDKACHGLLWDALAIVAELVLRGSDAWTQQLTTKSADCVKRIESVHALLSRQEAAAAKGGASKSGPPATLKAATLKGAKPPPPLQAKNGKAVGAPAKAGGKSGVGTAAGGRGGGGKAAPTVELSTRCLVSLKEVLTALGK